MGCTGFIMSRDAPLTSVLLLEWAVWIRDVETSGSRVRTRQWSRSRLCQSLQWQDSEQQRRDNISWGLTELKLWEPIKMWQEIKTAQKSGKAIQGKALGHSQWPFSEGWTRHRGNKREWWIFKFWKMCYTVRVAFSSVPLGTRPGTLNVSHCSCLPFEAVLEVPSYATREDHQCS